MFLQKDLRCPRPQAVIGLAVVSPCLPPFVSFPYPSLAMSFVCNASSPITEWPDSYSVDTTNVLFILSGAFVGLDAIIRRRMAKGVGQLRRNHSIHSLTALYSEVYRVYRQPFDH